MNSNCAFGNPDNITMIDDQTIIDMKSKFIGDVRGELLWTIVYIPNVLCCI